MFIQGRMMMLKANESLAPKILIRTWLDLLGCRYTPVVRKKQIEDILCRIFGSVELGEFYLLE